MPDDTVDVRVFRNERERLRVSQQDVADQLRVMGVKKPPTFREVSAVERQGATVHAVWLEAVYRVARGRLEEVHVVEVSSETT